MYLVDGQAASWFYRINEKKSDIDNLNSPSASFESYTDVGHLYGENAHGWHASRRIINASHGQRILQLSAVIIIQSNIIRYIVGQP